MEDPDRLVVTLTVAELEELLRWTAQVLVASMREALVEAAHVTATRGVDRARRGGPDRMPEPTSKLIGVKEVAQLLGAGERTVWKLSSCGVLPPVISIGRSRRWRRQDIESWIDRKAEAAEKERQKLARR